MQNAIKQSKAQGPDNIAPLHTHHLGEMSLSYRKADRKNFTQ